MKYAVRDTYPPPAVNAEHGIFGTLPEAQQSAWDVAVSRGSDPARLSWTRYTLTSWGLKITTATGPGYAWIGIEAEG